MLQIGEKVRYLNEEGEATILKFVTERTALVEDEHGFTHEHPVNQLVPATRHRETEKKELPPDIAAAKKPGSKPIVKKENHNVLPELALAFVSSNDENPETGDLDLLFINSSNFHILINIAAKDGDDWYSIFHGEVKADGRQPVLSFRRQDVGQVGNLAVDILFFKNSGHELRPPVSSTLKIKATRFVKGGNYAVHRNMENPAIVIPVNNDITAVTHVSASRSGLPKPRTIVGPSLPQFEEEVDLHLEKLTNDIHMLADHEKLALQLSHFEKRLNNAISSSYTHITFIHGVGKGKLRSEIHRILKEYDLDYEDGAFHRYGAGATVVRLS